MIEDNEIDVVPSIGCVLLRTGNPHTRKAVNKKEKGRWGRQKVHKQKTRLSRHSVSIGHSSQSPSFSLSSSPQLSTSCACEPHSYLSCSVIEMSELPSTLATLKHCYQSEDSNILFVSVEGDTLRPSAQVTRALAQEYLDYSMDLALELTKKAPPLGYETFRNALIKERAFDSRRLSIITEGRLEVKSEGIHIDKLFPPLPTPPPPTHLHTLPSPPATATSTVDDKVKKNHNRKQKSKKSQASVPNQAPHILHMSISGSSPSAPNLNFDPTLSGVILDPANLVISTCAAFKTLGIVQPKEEIFKQQIAQCKAKRARAQDKATFMVDIIGGSSIASPDYSYEVYASVLGSAGPSMVQAGPSQLAREMAARFRGRGRGRGRDRDRGRDRGRFQEMRYYNASGTHALLEGGISPSGPSNMEVDSLLPLPHPLTPTKPLNLVPKDKLVASADSDLQMVE
jgi:hypothetical protein